MNKDEVKNLPLLRFKTLGEKPIKFCTERFETSYQYVWAIKILDDENLYKLQIHKNSAFIKAFDNYFSGESCLDKWVFISDPEEKWMSTSEYSLTWNGQTTLSPEKKHISIISFGE